jgi:hypothetical protein
VLVQREMERWRAPLASIAPIPPGPVCTAEKRWRAGGRAATETATGFKKKIRLAWPRCTPIKEQANRNWLGKESITAWTLRTPRSPENRASRANLLRAAFCSYRLLFGKPVQGRSSGGETILLNAWRPIRPSCACDVKLCSLLLARQRGSQKSEFGLYFCGIGHGIRDFLSKEFAVPLAKPVNRNF